MQGMCAVAAPPTSLNQGEWRCLGWEWEQGEGLLAGVAQGMQEWFAHLAAVGQLRMKWERRSLRPKKSMQAGQPAAATLLGP
jgi:hypothetical protein